MAQWDHVSVPVQRIGPLGADPETVLDEFLLQALGQPAVLVVDVDVDHVQVLVGLLAELLHAVGEVSGEDVLALVDVVGLVNQLQPLAFGSTRSSEKNFDSG